MCVCVHMHACTTLWGSEDDFQESFLTFHYVGPKDTAWIVRLGLYPMYHLAHTHSMDRQDSYRRRQRAGHGRKDNWCPGAGRRSSSSSPSRRAASRRSQVTWRHPWAAGDTAWPGAVGTWWVMVVTGEFSAPPGGIAKPRDLPGSVALRRLVLCAHIVWGNQSLCVCVAMKG